MKFALTRDRARPRPDDVLKGREDLLARLPDLLAARSVTLWEAILDGDEEAEPEWGFTPKARIDAPARMGRDSFLDAVTAEALSAAGALYMHGDCWSLAAVASAMLDRPIALFVAEARRETGEPDHVAVDLGGGLYLDVRGVLDAAGVAVGLNEGARPEPETVDVAGLHEVYARHYGDEGSLADSLACSDWEGSTRVLVETFLADRAREAIAAAPAVDQAPRP